MNNFLFNTMRLQLIHRIKKHELHRFILFFYAMVSGDERERIRENNERT